MEPGKSQRSDSLSPFELAFHSRDLSRDVSLASQKHDIVAFSTGYHTSTWSYFSNSVQNRGSLREHELCRVLEGIKHLQVLKANAFNHHPGGAYSFATPISDFINYNGYLSQTSSTIFT